MNALIITGEALSFGLKNELANILMSITDNCKAVLCCRVSPK